MPMLNVGARVRPWVERAIKFLNHEETTALLSGHDPADTNWTDETVPTEFVGRAVRADLAVSYHNSTNSGKTIYVRRNGSSTTIFVAVRNTTISVACFGHISVAVDDTGAFEWMSDAGSSNTESLTIYLTGIWVWA
jgi:hypothetical protein